LGQVEPCWPGRRPCSTWPPGRGCAPPSAPGSPATSTTRARHPAAAGGLRPRPGPASGLAAAAGGHRL